MNRQDPAAAELFAKWLPGVRRAVTNPLPVIPIDREKAV